MTMSEYMLSWTTSSFENCMYSKLTYLFFSFILRKKYKKQAQTFHQNHSSALHNVEN